MDLEHGRPGGAQARRHDRLKQLRAFCETVRHGSLSAAARAIGSSQPAVSSQVRTLEDALGAALLRLGNGGVAPTRAGTTLYRIALPLVHGLLQLPELFEEHHHGTAPERLRIGADEASGASLLPALVSRFQALHPRMRIDVRAGAEPLAWLRGFEVDIVLGAIHPPPPDIELHPLAVSEAVVVTSRGHPLGRCAGVALEALARWPLVALSPGRPLRSVQDNALATAGVRAHIVAEVEALTEVLGLVAAGVGIAIVPSVCVSPAAPLCVVALKSPLQRRIHGLAVRRDGPLSPTARRFVDMAVSDSKPGGDAR